MPRKPSFFLLPGSRPATVDYGAPALPVEWIDLKARAPFARHRLTQRALDKALGTSASLSGVDLSGADLRLAILVFANCTRANFKQADLSGADLYGAKLTGAIFTGANLTNTRLSKHTR